MVNNGPFRCKACWSEDAVCGFARTNVDMTDEKYEKGTGGEGVDAK